jgi:hypothetical protein
MTEDNNDDGPTSYFYATQLLELPELQPSTIATNTSDSKSDRFDPLRSI